MLYWLRRKVYRFLAKPRVERLLWVWLGLDLVSLIVPQLFKR